MARQSRELTVKELRNRIARAEPSIPDRARRLLLGWLDTATQAMDARPVARALRDGVAATQIAGALHANASAAPALLACASGCAFCCILDGPDGGTITDTEARRLHAALAPLAGQPDGRAWHPKACPALDPENRRCRAYDARPSLCRAYVSTDAAACETNAQGGSAAGAGVLGFHLDYLSVLGLSRAALKGIAPLQTYALTKIAAAATEGLDVESALAQARHRPRMLDDVRGGLTSAAAAARDDVSKNIRS